MQTTTTEKSETMDARTRAMLVRWLGMHHGDVEALASWMRDNVRIGVGDARALILAATEGR